MRWLLIFLGVLVGASCSTPPPNKFSDVLLIKIQDLKDRRATDSLVIFLREKNPIYRREAALSLGSVQDSTASAALGTALLEDLDTEVRRNAAFALGQTGGFQAVNALLPALQDSSRSVLREVLEALGKTVDRRDVASLNEYQTRDTLLQEGQAWGFYQLTLRKKADSSVTRKMSSFLLPSHSYQTRLAAAHYFARSSPVIGTGYEENLLQGALNDNRPEVRMAALNGCRDLASEQVLPVVRQVLAEEKDYRVRVNAVRVLQNFLIAETSMILFQALSDPVEMVTVAASEVIRNIDDGSGSTGILENLSKLKSDRAKANLYAALLKSAVRPEILEEMVAAYSTGSVYYKAALLSAMGETKEASDKRAFKFLCGELLKITNEKVILTASAGAIVSLNHHDTTGIFLRCYQQALANGDEAVIGIVASALTDPSLGYKNEIKDLQFLYDAKAKMKLPRDIESLQPLNIAIAYLEGKPKPAPLKNEFNHPIDWNLVKSIPAIQEVEITTKKGKIRMRLLVEEAPGSVANFVDLVNKKYFDGKFFHRVVPNFVIQTGCNRGDGYGSEDYSIRSEFSLTRYTTGSAGMASAGKDTEGTQWFITHSPTPHLDGKYTIFAEAIAGMEVVDQIEMGDIILETRLVVK